MLQGVGTLTAISLQVVVVANLLKTVRLREQRIALEGMCKLPCTSATHRRAAAAAAPRSSTHAPHACRPAALRPALSHVCVDALSSPVANLEAVSSRGKGFVVQVLTKQSHCAAAGLARSAQVLGH
eukprot:scaffold55868_cov58-Phaeocystis_antarctica.AAC.3